MKPAATLLFLLPFSAGLVAGAAAPRAPESRPNFVFIIGDDISADDFGCYGNPGVRTPNIDRLARESLVFDNAYLTASSCSPSRCSIMTSRYPHNLESAAELHAPLPEGVALFPGLLRDAGYYTAHAGKAHFGTRENHGDISLVGPAKAAFDASSGGDTGDLAAGDGGENQWVKHLRTRPADRSFFMWFASHDAHRPWGPNSFSGMNRAEDVRVPPYLVDTPETRRDLAHYYDEITRLDHAVGEVIHELARQKLLDRTVVILLADNGRPFPHSKTHVYDDGMKTPLIIRWPGAIPGPARTDALVSSIDLAPTILDLAGVPRPPTFQGVSLLPILRDPKATVRDYIFAEQNWHNIPAHVRMVRHQNFVYLRNAWPELPLSGASDTFYNPSADALKALYARGQLTPAQANVFMQPRATEELYDLSSDPAQIDNIVRRPDASATLQRLRALLTRWEQETGDTVPVNRTPADIDYVTGAKKAGFRRGEPPGATAHALQINRPGPVRDH